MTASPRQIPMEVALWMDKDVKLPKLNEKAGPAPTDTKQNAILNRNFFADLLDLSSRRYRSINRFDLEKQHFVQQQQSRAESGMPGLLPYIAQFGPTTSRSLASSRTNLSNIDGPSLPFVRSHAMPAGTNDKLQPAPPKARSKRKQESMDRLNRLAQPRGRPLRSLDHVRSHYVQPLTVRDLFGEVDDASTRTSGISHKSKSVTSDTRFQQLVESCEDIHVPELSARKPTVESIVQSNSSLQDGEGRWHSSSKAATRTVELKKHISKLNKQFSSTRSIHLIDQFTC